MSKQADSSSLSAASPLTAFSSIVVLPPEAESLNAPNPGPSVVRPHYYLERPDGTLTALVEVDQLPDHVRIRGLPQKLSIADTTGMTSVGMREGGRRKYFVEIGENSANFYRGEPSKSSATKNTDLENPPFTIATTPSTKAPGDTMILLNERVSTLTPTCTDQETVISKPIVQNEKKVYCTYWIARGECHFAQQGCRFKHEMPNLEILEKIMGRRSFPKWWLESIGHVSAPPPHLRPIAASDRQQGKRRAMVPKPIALPAPTNVQMNSASSPALPSIVAPALPEEFSANMFKSSSNTSGNKIVARKDGGYDIRSYVSAETVSNMHSPVAGPSGSNIRVPFTRPTGGNIRSSIAGPSAISGHASISGTISSNSITQSKQPVPEIRSTDSGRNNMTGPLIPGLSGRVVISANQPVGNIRSPHDSSPNGSNMKQIKQQIRQLVNNEQRDPVSGTMSNTSTQITKLPDNSLTTPTSPTHQTAALKPLHVKVPRKYPPSLRIAVLPTLSSFHSPSSSTSKPRVNLPALRRQDIASSGQGNTEGSDEIVSSIISGNTSASRGRIENRREGIMEGRLDEGRSTYYTSPTTVFGGSRSYRDSQTTQPYDKVFDLLGPF